MDFADDAPQLGLVDVDRDALSEHGVALTELITDLGVELDASTAVDAPAGGWRVLRRYTSGAMVIGAPADASGSAWRVAHVAAPAARSVTMVHPDPMALRPSRAERRRGLELRWPALMSTESPTDGFVVDIVNTGAARWYSAADGFYVVGSFTTPETSPTAFGWMASSQGKALPLDPGEYARVSVTINSGAWATLEPGTYELHALLVGLGLRTKLPLTVHLSAETIAGNRERNASPTSHPAHHRRILDQQIAHLQAQMSASRILDRIAAAVLAADTDEDAIAGIGRILSVDETLASAVYQSALRELGPDRTRRDMKLARLIAQRES